MHLQRVLAVFLVYILYFRKMLIKDKMTTPAQPYGQAHGITPNAWTRGPNHIQSRHSQDPEKPTARLLNNVDGHPHNINN